MSGLIQRLPAFLTNGLSTLKPTLFLFAVDSLANLIDYIFHIYLGRALVPGDFAVFQTVNSALLIAVTAFGVMQPVLARFIAEAETKNGRGIRLSVESRGLFRTYFYWSALVGLALAALFWLLVRPFSGWLNVPPFAVRMGALVVFFVLLRPVVAGTLQGAQRFMAFGATRLAYAAGRFAFAFLVITSGFGLSGAVASLPVGQLLAVLAGLVFLGNGILHRLQGSAPQRKVSDGLRLAGYAFIAYAAFTALQNLDLLWVNRLFTPEESGAYAAAVLLRRVLILFPGAATVVMYPRIVSRIALGGLPDRLVGWTLALVAVAVSSLAAFYYFFGPWIVSAAFGEGYEAAGPLLGVMGAAMLGYAITSVWLNLFLATRPVIFVAFLTLTTVLQAALLTFRSRTLVEVAGVFAVSGWLLAISGGLVYIFSLRPTLKSKLVPRS